MDLRALRAFVEVVKQGGFSAAARTLFAAQPTVSKAVRQLEDEVGTPLLDRLGHGVRLTPAGERVYRRALAMLAERDHLQADLADLRGLKQGRLRLGLSRLGSSILFARLVAEFRQRYPGIEIELAEHGSLRLAEMLRDGALELAMCLLPVPDDLDWQLVHDDPLVALLPMGHPLAGRPSCTLAELASTPFILFEEGFALNPQILGACRHQGFLPQVVAHSGQVDFIQALVAAGLGVAFLPALVAGDSPHPAIARTVLVGEDLRWRITLAWRRDGCLSPAAAAYLALARQAIGPGSALPDPIQPIS
jgi:DNA-binding transcriptional LysR family regulator